jgi:hypothetical protein
MQESETSAESCAVAALESQEWPVEALMILSALQAGEASSNIERRGPNRIPHQVCAALRLFSDPEGSAPWKLYTRDITARSLGFIAPGRLPLGYGGIVQLQGPYGHTVQAHCTLFRCRQTVQGWYEGALSFHRPQWDLLGQVPEPEDE